MKAHLAGLVPFAIVTLFTAARADGRGVLVSPSQLGLSGMAGSEVSGVITVASSRQGEENAVRVSVLDFVRSDEGKVALIDKGGAAAPARSCRSWLTVDQTSFTSPKSGRFEVIVRAKIPQGSTGSYWAAVVIASLPPARLPRRVYGVQIVPQVAVPVIITVEGTEKRSIVIRDLVATRRDGTIDAEAVLVNDGNTAVFVNGAMTVERDASGVPEELASADLKQTLSLPGTRVEVKTTVRLSGPTNGARLHALLRFGPARGDVADSETVIVDAARESAHR